MTHTSQPVPYLLFDSARDGAGGAYTEPATERVRTGRRAHVDGPAARAGVSPA